ncbi:MAG: hypothetical protein ACREL3_02960 [Gemmatimonadales bacterium]
MPKARSTLEHLLHSFPEERENLRPYVDRAKAFSNECGCSMGGAFMVGALGLVVVYGVLFDGFAGHSRLTDLLGGAVLVCSAGIIGKLTGVGVARIRLALLYRDLRIRYVLEGD